MRKREESANVQRIIPLVREDVKVGKRPRVTGTTRVRTVVREEAAIADEPLLQEEVSVRRIRVNEYIDAPRAVREDAGTTIIPVMEEVLVVQKRLLLREEVHITKHSRTVHRPEGVVLRKQDVVVERGRKNEQERPVREAAGKGGK